MAEIKLRPYQKNFIDSCRDEYKHGIKRVLGVAPCGAGKTIMTGWMIRESLNKGYRSVFIVHRKELIDQTAETFERLNIPFGIIAAGEPPTYSLPVQIASVQTLINRMDCIAEPDFIIVDECHHVLANTYMNILDCWRSAVLLGVTATPVRLSKKEKLNLIFDSIVTSISTPSLIRIESLTPVRSFTIPNVIDLSNVNVEMGDYDKQAISKMMSKPDVCEKIVEEFLRRAPNKKAIAYCVDVPHSKLLADTFRAHGINAVQCDGSTEKKKRKEIIEKFRRGEYQILCNAELFGEGFDVPNCHAVILARPTKSLGLYIQQAMRPMRPDPEDPNKVAMVFDFVGNISRFGLPDKNRNGDWEREFEKDVKVGDGDAKTKNCPVCGKAVPISTLICGGVLSNEEVKAIRENILHEMSAEQDNFVASIANEIKQIEISVTEKTKLILCENSEVVLEGKQLPDPKLELVKILDQLIKKYLIEVNQTNKEKWRKAIADTYSRLKMYLIDDGCGYCFNPCEECNFTVNYKAVNCPNCGHEMKQNRLDAEQLVEVTGAVDDSPVSEEIITFRRDFRKTLEYILYVQKKYHFKDGWIYYRVKEYARTFEDFEIAAEVLKIKKPKTWAGYQMLERAKTFDEILAIEKAAGFKPGWAYVQAKDRNIEIPKKRG